MKRRLVALTIPVMLLGGVGCSKEEAQVKETDSLEVSQNDSSGTVSSSSSSNYQKETLKMTDEWSNLYLEISRKTSVGGD
ncbi:hypothetical protein GH891_31935, partial [Bacillus thuringiensis]|nr:hypothetical protein [Bacillus thuringiensis]